MQETSYFTSDLTIHYFGNQEIGLNEAHVPAVVTLADNPAIPAEIRTPLLSDPVHFSQKGLS